MIADWRKLFGQGDFRSTSSACLPSSHAARRPLTEMSGPRRASRRRSRRPAFPTLPGRHHRHRRRGQHSRQGQTAVGERLALCALANQYRRRSLIRVRLWKSVDRRSAKSDYTSRTRTAAGGEGNKAGRVRHRRRGRKWYWADARIKGKTLLSPLPRAQPQRGSLCWQSNPAATPVQRSRASGRSFRTDTWPGMTDSHRPY